MTRQNRRTITTLALIVAAAWAVWILLLIGSTWAWGAPAPSGAVSASGATATRCCH